MFTSIYSGAVCGIEGQLVRVEADISDGFPSYSLVGYLASEVKEARERVSAALKNSGMRLPAKKIIINLSPAGMRKQGTAYDLPIALSILGSLGVLPQDKLNHVFAAGELSLDGSLRPVKGILSLILMAKAHGISTCLVPRDNLKEAMLAQYEGGQSMNIIGVSDLKAACACFLGGKAVLEEGSQIIFGQSCVPEDKKLPEFLEAGSDAVDFAEIAGQESLKRAIMAAVSGMHHLLMIGPPGCGKSMSARAIRGILPPMTIEESLEVTRLYSVAGLLDKKDVLVTRPPFRSPHHTVPIKTMTGGGSVPVPGEISLAHRGILFLDELAEFAPATLEVLRQPLEEGVITINRLHGSFVFPAGFMLVAAMNPCRCGYYPDRNRCQCTPADVYRYLHRISRPLWNRIDVCVEVHPPVGENIFKENTFNKENIFNRKEPDKVHASAAYKGLDSASMARMVRRARQVQKQRFAGTGISFNSQMTGAMVKRYCISEPGARAYVSHLAESADLTMRAQHKLMKVARTIADLDGEERILEQHLDEALCYRMVEQSYWDF